MNVEISRDDPTPSYIRGQISVDGTPVCESLELPYRGNVENDSSIPLGTYEGKFQWSDRHQRNLWTLDVPGRIGIEFHIGNTVLDTEGCILLGTSRGYLACVDGQTRAAVLGSYGAFDRFELALQGQVVATFVFSTPVSPSLQVVT
jgi:hypothetical protein